MQFNAIRTLSAAILATTVSSLAVGPANATTIPITSTGTVDVIEPSVITSKAAIRDHFKTGHMKSSGTGC